jgi:hypothetical protein
MSEYEPTDYEIATAMERFGGSFAVALSLCCFRADAENLDRIKAAFPELWAEYAEYVRMQRDRAATR